MFKKFFGIIVLAALAFTVGFTIYSCAEGSRQEDIAQSLPQITTKAQLEEARAGDPQVYACLNVPITGSAAKDRFHILKDDYISIMYHGEEYVETFSTDSKTGETWNYYKWEGNGDDTTSMGSRLYAFGDVPISLDGADFDNPDVIGSVSEIDLSAYKNGVLHTVPEYFYPDGDADVEGNIRYRVYLVKPGISAAFLGVAGDNKFSVYCADNEDADTSGNIASADGTLNETNPTIWIGGDMSDLTYLASEQDTGSVIMCWIAFLFIAFVYMMTPEKE